MLQVRSDLEAGKAVLDVAEAATYCQALSKFQQVVEKSIKAMVAALNESGLSIVNIGSEHYPEKQIDALRLIKRAVSQDLLSRIYIIFSGHRLGEVRALCLLAPRFPTSGEAFRRNTEYPYQGPDSSWTAPAAVGSFRLEEVYRFRNLATEIVPMVARFVQATRRGLR